MSKHKLAGNRAGFLHAFFDLAPVKDACEWYGTQWEGEGKDIKLLPCGALTVGNGLFCDERHEACQILSVCERHKKPIEDWSVPGVQGWEL